MILHDPYESDLSSKSGAERIAKRIENYWAMRGYSLIKTSIYPVKTLFQTRGTRSPIYGVVSNIGPTGYPPREPA